MTGSWFSARRACPLCADKNVLVAAWRWEMRCDTCHARLRYRRGGASGLWAAAYGLDVGAVWLVASTVAEPRSLLWWSILLGGISIAAAVYWPLVVRFWALEHVDGYVAGPVGRSTRAARTPSGSR